MCSSRWASKLSRTGSTHQWTSKMGRTWWPNFNQANRVWPMETRCRSTISTWKAMCHRMREDSGRLEMPILWLRCRSIQRTIVSQWTPTVYWIGSILTWIRASLTSFRRRTRTPYLSSRWILIKLPKSWTERLIRSRTPTSTRAWAPSSSPFIDTPRTTLFSWPATNQVLASAIARVPTTNLVSLSSWKRTPGRQTLALILQNSNSKSSASSTKSRDLLTWMSQIWSDIRQSWVGVWHLCRECGELHSLYWQYFLKNWVWVSSIWWSGLL